METRQGQSERRAVKRSRFASECCSRFLSSILTCTASCSFSFYYISQAVFYLRFVFFPAVYRTAHITNSVPVAVAAVRRSRIEPVKKPKKIVALAFNCSPAYQHFRRCATGLNYNDNTVNQACEQTCVGHCEEEEGCPLGRHDIVFEVFRIVLPSLVLLEVRPGSSPRFLP